MSLEKIEILTEFLSSEIVEGVLRKNKGIEELWPIQISAIKNGLFEGKSLVVSAPSGSGKTLIGELAAVFNSVKGLNTLYLVPYKALAEEKRQMFLKDYKGWFNTALFTSDYTSSDSEISNSKVFIGTYEKIDLLLRNQIPWLSNINVIILDEAQMIDDKERGPILETVVARIVNLNKNVQVIALSATLEKSSAEEIGKWLNAILIYDDWRPVPLIQGYCSFLDEKIFFDDESEEKISLPQRYKTLLNGFKKEQLPRIIRHDQIKRDVAIDLVKKFVREGKQVLVFAMYRKASGDFCESIGELKKSKELDGIAGEVIASVAEPSQITKRLETRIKNGTAFHHAGLTSQERSVVEEGFRNRHIPIICSTPTLAAGVNLPADVVIFLDHARRYPPPTEPIKIIDYQNMSGRAGRPGYSKKGISILIGTDKSEEEELKKYVNSKPERIFSKMTYIPQLRKIVLALLASDSTIESITRLVKFMKATFFGTQYEEDMERIKEKIEDVIKNYDESLIKVEQERIQITELGKVVSRTGLDPDSIKTIVTGLSELEKLGEMRELQILQIVTQTIDYLTRSYIFIPERELNHYIKSYEENRENFILKPLSGEKQYVDIKGALLLNSWILEESIPSIAEKYNVMPGDIEGNTSLAAWILESIIEIAKVQKVDVHTIECLNALRKRLEYGIKPDLLEIFKTELTSIGRQQARKLYNEGFKTPEQILEAPFEKLPLKGVTKIRLKKEIIKKSDFHQMKKTMWLQVLEAFKIKKDPKIIKRLYEATGGEFEHWTELAFAEFFGNDKVERIEQQDADVDILIKGSEEECFAAIECYSPEDITKESTPNFHKVAEAVKSLDKKPRHLCFCTNALIHLDEKYLLKIVAIGITYFHSSGIAELLLKLWKKKINREEIEAIFNTKGKPIDANFVRGNS